MTEAVFLFSKLGRPNDKEARRMHAPKCDFRFKKGGETASGWPPEGLEEWKRND